MDGAVGGGNNADARGAGGFTPRTARGRYRAEGPPLQPPGVLISTAQRGTRRRIVNEVALVSPFACSADNSGIALHHRSGSQPDDEQDSQQHNVDIHDVILSCMRRGRPATHELPEPLHEYESSAGSTTTWAAMVR